MRIVWCSWKDMTHPYAGGAERITDAILSRFARDGHTVQLFASGFPGAAQRETVNGYTVVRLGNRWTVYWKVFLYYRKELRGWADIVVDEMNTIPFFCRWYVKEPVLLFTHQLCRKIWFFEMVWPLNILGFIAEPAYLWVLRRSKVMTVSQSTQKDLLRFGFDAARIYIIPEGVDMKPVDYLAQCDMPRTLIVLGAIRHMKQTHHVIEAFEIAKKTIPELQLSVVGRSVGRYGQRVVRSIQTSPFRESITYHGPVNEETKRLLLQKADILCSTSLKEGWGLVVTEANTQGVPAIVYDHDGLRDSVKDAQTGVVVEDSPQAFADAIIALVSDIDKYTQMRRAAWTWSQKLTLENTYQVCAQVIKECRNI